MTEYAYLIALLPLFAFLMIVFFLRWKEKVASGFSINDVKNIIPPNNNFIVAEPSKFGRQVPEVRKGYYWGLPSSDNTAIRELENLRKNESHFLVLSHEVFWWLEYFPELKCHLWDNFLCVQQDDRFIVFDLRSNVIG